MTTPLTSTQVQRAEEITFETALEEISRLKDVTRKEGDGVEVYSGVHPELGGIHIIMPAAGASFRLLPFAIRDF